MEIKSYIPESKHDTELIAELSRHEYPFYRSILKELFEWIQDMNWPVAKLIVPLLVKAGSDVTPVVRDILNSKDSMWIYWTLTIILNDFNYSDGKLITSDLKTELSEKLNNPTADECADTVPELIGELFAKYEVIADNE
ncbi:MAG: hypothetical protein CVV49_19770 [Spirochaetae bacterium HGW-Spirochaetae-5]|nr:MAG: hypothetical protein CVV49_19770 [Spirochaetae bacterium HGW-Spirochaetae-5]